MTPDRFINRWAEATLNEAAGAKPHFLDLCDLLDVPKPHEDNQGTTYAFEKMAAEANGRHGFADVWKRGCFAWEYKRPGADLGAAHVQLLRYAGNLGNPPLLVASDMRRIVVRTAWTNEVTEETRLELPQLRERTVLDRLREMWRPPPEAWRPRKSRAALTEQAAGDLGELAQRLRSRGHEPQAVAHFVCRLAFCFFAADVKLLPRALLDGMLDAGRRAPGRFAEYAGKLFAAMAERGGEIGFASVPWFNGGLFEDASALPVAAADVALLDGLGGLEWSDIDPSIMGTLFERGLDPGKRGQLGAHYTDRATIERIVGPVVRQPLQAEWAAARERIEATLAKRAALRAGAAAGGGEGLAAFAGEAVTAESAAKRRALAREGERRRDRGTALFREAEKALGDFLARLRAFRVLDAACGSGNFLYVALQALKDLEGTAIAEAAALGLPPLFPEVGPEAVLGIELNPYAAELARVSVWIGHIQWALRNGYPAPHDPVLRRLDTIECRDAVLRNEKVGRPLPAAWPAADAIVGNPPFIGGKALRRSLGDGYVDRLFAAYDKRVPAEADFVTYWFDQARQALADGSAQRAGLVATNSIRGGANREVLERAARVAPIAEAWADEPWTLDGAAVRVSLVCLARGHTGPARLNGREAAAVFADLTAGGADLTRAARLPANAGVCFMGTTKVGPFDVDGATARTWLREPPNANGGQNSDVVRPWRNGLHVTRRPADAWVVDFGTAMPEAEAAWYASPFAHAANAVRPLRLAVNPDTGEHEQRRKAYREAWWRHGEARPDMRAALAGLPRYIATPRVAKHRLFVWLNAAVVPDCQLIIAARADDAFFGVLHSRFHEAWALRLGTSLEDRPRYTPTTSFETFPFPDGLTPDLPAATWAADPRAAAVAAAARALDEARERWLNPPELVRREPEVAPGLPDRLVPVDAAAAAALAKRTLTALYNARGTPAGAWLDNLHAALNAAVAAAYGWAADLPTDEALARLLALNLARANAGTDAQQANRPPVAASA